VGEPHGHPARGLEVVQGLDELVLGLQLDLFRIDLLGRHGGGELHRLVREQLALHTGDHLLDALLLELAHLLPDEDRAPKYSLSV
jgi:hypothetical protein